MIRTIKIGDTLLSWDGLAWSWEGGMEVDADGSPRAYAPVNSGIATLDALANAGGSGKWYGILCNAAGVPYVQQAHDPYPGAYISKNPLQDTRYSIRDPRRYADPEAVPFIAVPPELEDAGVKIGDIATVRRGELWCGAIVGDVGPHKKFGEAAILVHQILGLNPFRAKPRHLLVGVESGIRFRVYPRTASTPRWPRSDIQQAARTLEIQARPQ